MANRHYHFKFNVEKDATYIQRLDAQENMQQYIRRLILSDIAADGLKDMIRFNDPESDVDPDEDYEIRREDFYAKHCQAIGDPDASCKGCIYYDPQEYGGNCNIEDEFRLQYGKAVTDGKQIQES